MLSCLWPQWPLQGHTMLQSLDPVLLNVPRTGSICSLAMAMISPAVHRLIVAGE